MTGLSARFVNTMTEILTLSLRHLVKYEYGEFWYDEYQAIEEWRRQHGVMAYFDNDTGHVTFTMGIVDPSDVPPNYTVVVYPADR